MADLNDVPVDEGHVKQLADRDYPLLVSQKEGGVYVRVPDLPGCAVSGESLDEAMSALIQAKRAWVEMALAIGRKVPEPSARKSPATSD